MSQYALVPMQTVGPLYITGDVVNEAVYVPLATYEIPLWPSVHRGAKVSKFSSGIGVTILRESMTRSVAFECPSASEAKKISDALGELKAAMNEVIAQSSRYAKLTEVQTQVVGRLLYIRFALTTGDASGHNMVTQAADQLMAWLMARYASLTYVSISGNFCSDKKVSAVNSLMGRGKYVIAEMTISRKICQRYLRTTPEQVVALNIKKNLLGSVIAGAVCSANAHVANMLLAIYLATGQDAANIVEGSQAISYAEVIEDALYFSVTLPNVIVGTVGNGKGLDFVQDNLRALGCLAARPAGENARRLAAIVGATVLCGELSLLAAQTNPGELMKSHIALERLGAAGQE